MPELRQMKVPLLVVMLNVLLSLGVWAFGGLPETVPLSWWQGEPLLTGSRWTLMLRVPGFMLLILVAIAVGLRWDLTLTGRRRAGALGPVLFLFLAYATYGHLRGLLLAATGATYAPPAVGDFVVAGLLLAGIGNYLPKAESNGFWAMTFPWLKGHERAYLRTQRAAAWLFIAAGALFMFGSPLLITLPWSILTFILPIAFFPILLAVTLASWMFAREDARSLEKQS